MAKQIELTVEEIVHILERVDPLVVSMDRIGSRFHNDEAAEAEAFYRFALDFDIARRLAEVRGFL